MVGMVNIKNETPNTKELDLDQVASVRDAAATGADQAQRLALLFKSRGRLYDASVQLNFAYSLRRLSHNQQAIIDRRRIPSKKNIFPRIK